MDYHDLKILQLETAAVEHLNEARLALERGEETAAEEVQRWETTVEKIRQIKSPEATGSAFQG